MPWFIEVSVLASALCLPAVLMDVIAGRQRWRWAFGYPVDRPEDETVWRHVRVFRGLNAVLAAAALGFWWSGPAVGAVVVGGYWIAFIPAWAAFAGRHLPRAEHPKRFVVEVQAPRFVAMLQPRWELPIWALVVLPIVATPWMAASLPARIPMHWGASGVDGWGSPSELYWLCGLGVPLQLLLWAVMALVCRGTAPRVPADKADVLLPMLAEEKRTVLALLQWIRLLVAVTTALIWLALVNVGMSGKPDRIWLFIAGIVAMDPIVLAVVGYWVFRLIHLRGRMKELGFDPVADRAEGYIWGGMLYYDRNDLALWVPKRVGVGWTLNMARPAAWVFLGAVVAVALASVVLPLVLR
ncbi:MAG: DUF1648 domain-containing protein [Deltaproteobacteria bacterium]|nr:DUF1648 domain-containing protein [Deltaproteobacteria bacterium]